MIKLKKEALVEFIKILKTFCFMDETSSCKKKYFYLKIGSFLLYNDENLALLKLNELKDILNQCEVVIREGFIENLENWIDKNIPCRKERFKILKDIFENNYKRAVINSMHYKDEEKIDAKTFMEESGIDEDLIEELEEELKEFKNLSSINITLTEEYIKEILAIIKVLKKVFIFSVEFKSLSLALENLEETLENLNLEEIDEDKKHLLKDLLDSIFFDIEKWFEEVIIKQSAKDIHYLDAALFANIEQIKVLLTNSTEDDEEIEFF